MAGEKLTSKSEMNRPEPKKNDAYLAELRRKSEEKLKRIENELSAIPDESVKKLVHELNVHQMELEMQNEELRSAQEALEKSRSKFSYLYDFAPIGYFTCDHKGVILEINLTGAGQLGYERTILIGRPFALYLQSGEMQAFLSHLKKVFETGSKQSCELKLKRKNGSHFDARLESTISVYDKGAQCLTAVMDITQLKEAEDKLKLSNAELEQFAYAASHDMREPLRTIAGFVKLLEKRYKGRLDERADEYINFAIDSVARLDMLLSDLVEFSRLETKTKKFEPVSASAALERAIFDLHTAIEESYAEITYDLLPIVVANESQITRLFQNLISNSIKFRSDKKLRIHISAEKKGNEWVFSIRDNGIGIDPKFAERIFVVFQRLHTKQEYEGSGMGLALCRKIVEVHGGRIWVESELGKGSTFYFTLPFEVASKD